MIRVYLAFLGAVAALPQSLPFGQIIDNVATAADPEQRYALYLPAKYNARRAWPVIFAFDPGARGRRAVEQYQVAAETFGYIVAASNVSRNGSLELSMNAARAMAVDVTARFSIDEKRIYAAGMSGGARVAMAIALSSNNMIAGVIASSAGFPDSNPRKTVPFVVFGTAGTEDFNWLEMRSLDHALTTPHRVVIFEGGHVWLSSELAVEAVEWLDLQAMKSGRIPRDEDRIKTICSARQATTMAVMNVWQRFQALDALHLDCDLPAPAMSKAVKDAQKIDKAEEFQERRLLGDILDLERELNVPERHSESFARLQRQWKQLAALANGEADSPSRRSARRVTRGLVMGAEGRTTDLDYLKLLATFRPARAGAR
jgi:predicted esterase